MLLAWAIVIGFSKVFLQAMFNVATSFPQTDVLNPFLLQSPSSTRFKRASITSHSVSSTQRLLPLVLNGLLVCSCYRLWINRVKIYFVVTLWGSVIFDSIYLPYFYYYQNRACVFLTWIYILRLRKRTSYISEICYIFILAYMPFTTFIVIYLYYSAVNRALLRKLPVEKLPNEK